MGSVVKTFTDGYTTIIPDFITGLLRDPDPHESWATIISSVGTEITSTHVLADGATAGLYTRYSSCNVGFDLRDYSLLNVASATLAFRLSSASGGNDWATEAQGGLALVGQRESTRGVNATVGDATEIYYSAVNTGDLANRINYSDLVAGTYITFTFNGTGLAYLNSLSTKTYNPGYAYLGVVFGGVVDAVAPTWNSGNRIVRFTNGVVFPPTLSLTFTDGDASAQINVGDAWYPIVGAQINQSGVGWNYVSDIDLNIADAWKDRA